MFSECSVSHRLGFVPFVYFVVLPVFRGNVESRKGGKRAGGIWKSGTRGSGRTVTKVVTREARGPRARSLIRG